MPAAARTAIWPEGVARRLLPYSPAIRAGEWVFVSGHEATEDAGVDPESPFLSDELELQSRAVFGSIAATLAAAGCDLKRDVVRTFQWLPSPHPTYEEFLAGSSRTGIPIHSYLLAFNDFLDEPRPASTAMGVRGLLPPHARVAIDQIAMLPREDLVRQGVDLPPDVPQPVAKYSPALRSGDWVFLAGDLPTDFRGDVGQSRHLGEPSGLAPEARINPYFWYGSSIEAQTDYLLSKLEKLARAAGASFERCVKADVYIGHPQDLDGIERVWRRWFPENPPARVVIPYTGIAVQGARIEIALVLLADDSELAIERIETSDAPEPFLHEPQALRAGDLLFLSTQLPADSSGTVPDELTRAPGFPHYGQPARRQLAWMLEHVAAICEAGGTSLANVCRRQTFHDDLARAPETMDEWQAAFPDDPPAALTVELGGPLIAPGAHLLLDLIAHVPAQKEER
jgi:enamine deaminase RidA (YjgF/YER057c/UK114 family)